MAGFRSTAGIALIVCAVAYGGIMLAAPRKRGGIVTDMADAPTQAIQAQELGQSVAAAMPDSGHLATYRMLRPEGSMGTLEERSWCPDATAGVPPRFKAGRDQAFFAEVPAQCHRGPISLRGPDEGDGVWPAQKWLAAAVNALIAAERIHTVIALGIGDGAQVRRSKAPALLGLSGSKAECMQVKRTLGSRGPPRELMVLQKGQMLAGALADLVMSLGGQKGELMNHLDTLFTASAR